MHSNAITLADLPPEVLLDNLLPILPVPDLLNLTKTSKYFASLCSDETFWRRKLLDDFNFDGVGTARRTGWKFIYRGLAKPKVFVWGERSNGRLGLRRFPKTSARGGIPFPTQLQIPEARIIKLIAGGMSFHALDTRGNVYVWGTLDGSDYTLQSDGYSRKGKLAATPLQLQLPTSIRSISCGRLHFSALDSKNTIWTFVNWGRPFKLASSLLTAYEPLQIECGWAFSSVLMKTGEVLVWWPNNGSLAEIIRQEDERLDAQGVGKASALNGIIPCHTWTADVGPTLLASLPPLPDVTDAGEALKEDPPRLVEIGAMDAHIIGLTNYGHVLKIGRLDEQSATTARWQYLPEFSEFARIRSLPAFSGSTSEENQATQTMVSEATRITHISAHFLHFFAYSTGSSSIVLQGDVDTKPDSKPKVIPELQHKNIISVVIGDYHNAALAANGKLYTWGQFSNGALGLGEPSQLPIGSPGGYRDQGQLQRAQERGYGSPPDVDVPTEVRFDHGRKKPKERFCFSVTAAGWHTGALAIDLEPDETEEDDEVDNLESDPEERPRSAPERTAWQNPPIIPLRGMFPFGRVGYAGRGIGRGQGRGGAPDT